MHDTLRYVKRLEAVGIPRPQAEAQVEIMSNFVDQNFATKHGLKDLGAEMRGEMKTLSTELRSDMQILASELRSEMRELAAELRNDMQVMRAEITRDLTIRMGVMFAASTTLTITVLGVMLSVLLHH